MVDNSHSGAKQRSEPLHLQVLFSFYKLTRHFNLYSDIRSAISSAIPWVRNGTRMPSKSAELRNGLASGLAAWSARP